MQDFYRQYLDPSSKERARLSIHLHARGASELDKKIIDILQGLSLSDVPEEKRQSLDLLESHLKEDKKLDEVKLTEVLSKVQDAGLKNALAHNEESKEATLLMADAVQSAKEITDAKTFKAGLESVSGGRPLNPLSKFEDIETKL